MKQGRLKTIKLDRNWQVPDFQIKEFKPLKNHYCLCVFVINEGEKIQKQLWEMKPFAKIVDIIIADGGSTDGSLSDDLLNKTQVRTLLTKIGPGKLSAQMRMAFAYTLKEGYQGVVVMDGNHKDDPASIPLFIMALDQGYDHIQGSRFIKGGKTINTPLSRLLGVKFIHAPLISLAAGFPYTDTTNGFRAYSRRFLNDPQVAVFRDIFSRYELHYYLSIQAGCLGFRIKEVPVTRAYPSKTKTPTKISPIKGNFLVLKTLFKAIFHQYDLKKINA